MSPRVFVLLCAVLVGCTPVSFLTDLGSIVDEHSDDDRGDVITSDGFGGDGGAAPDGEADGDGEGDEASGDHGDDDGDDGLAECVLVFAAEPTDVVVDEPLEPAVVIGALDATTRTPYAATGTITLSLLAPGEPSPTPAVLASAEVVAGAATFPSLVIGAPGTSYRLVAAGIGCTPATSTSFDVVAGAQTLYRSVGAGTTAPLVVAAPAATLIVSHTTARFAQALPLWVGVGDVLSYDSNGDDLVDAVAVVHARASATELQVRSSSGGVPRPVDGTDSGWAIARAYTSLADAALREENEAIPAAVRDFDSGAVFDLVAAGVNLAFACYADAPDTSTNVEFTFTTGAANRLIIFAPHRANHVGVSQRHRGRWTESGFIFAPSVYADYGLSFNLTGSVEMEGVQIDWPDSNPSRAAITARWLTDDSKVRISHSLLRYLGSAPSQNGIVLAGGVAAARPSVWLHNNVLEGFTGTGISLGIGADNSSDGNYVVYNNTVVGCGTGIVAAAAAITRVKNNLVQACGVSFTGTFADDSDYNVVDTVAEPTPGAHSHAGQIASFVDSTAHDFHLFGQDTAARDQGMSLSADPFLPFTDDFDGDPRSGVWDVGADER